MALDYNQKKQVSKNRPRKRPVKFLLLLILGSVFSIYGLGIATGWLIFKYLPQNTPTSLADSAKLVGADQVPPSPAPVSSKGGSAAQNKEPDLTFYYTLPKGDKGVIGSGMNRFPSEMVPRQETPATTPAQIVRPVQQQKEVVVKKESAEPAVQKEKAGTPSRAVEPTSAIQDSAKATYTVQVAAFHAKSDAQELKVKLQKAGVSCRIEEFNVPGKGLWYRVRAGSKLDKETANKLAAKTGNNAILVAE
jgi:cell division protein FtsN